MFIRVDFRSDFSGRLKNRVLCPWFFHTSKSILCRVKSYSVTRSGEKRVIRFILNTFSFDLTHKAINEGLNLTMANRNFIVQRTTNIAGDKNRTLKRLTTYMEQMFQAAHIYRNMGFYVLIPNENQLHILINSC